MRRLTEKIEDGTNIIRSGYEIQNGYIEGCGPYIRGEAVDKLADYEDAEEQGLLIRLPCKVGDYVYRIFRSTVSTRYTIEHNGHLYSREVYQHYIDEVPFEIDMLDEIGKTAFCNKEQAYEVLAELEE